MKFTYQNIFFDENQNGAAGPEEPSLQYKFENSGLKKTAVEENLYFQEVDKLQNQVGGSILDF